MPTIDPISSSIGALEMYTNVCLEDIKRCHDSIETDGGKLSLDALQALKLKTQVEQKAQLDYIQSQTNDLASRINEVTLPRIVVISFKLYRCKYRYDELVRALDSLIDLSISSSDKNSNSLKAPKSLTELELLMRSIPTEGPLDDWQKKKFNLGFSSDAYVEYTYFSHQQSSLSPEVWERIQILDDIIRRAFIRCLR